jgi:hypothetical protein
MIIQLKVNILAIKGAIEMKKTIMNENWEEIEVIDASNIFVLIFKQGSDIAAYIKDYDIDEQEMLSKHQQLVADYKDVKFEEPTCIVLVKLPTTSQVRTMLADATYAGDETNAAKIEIINHLLGRADCEYVKEKVLTSLEEAKKRKKKKKKTPRVTYTWGMPWYNDHMFNHHIGSCDCGKGCHAAGEANSSMGNADAGAGGEGGNFSGGTGVSGDGSAGDGGGAMAESFINEATLTPFQKMQALENGTRGFNAGAANDLKLIDNLVICAQNNFQKAAVVIIREIQARMNQGVWTLGPLPGFTMSSTVSTPATTASQAVPLPLKLAPSDFNPIDLQIVKECEENTQRLITAIERHAQPVHWAIVCIVFAVSGGYINVATALKAWLLTKISSQEFKQIIAAIKQDTDIITRVTEVCNDAITEGVQNMHLAEAKRYIKRYFIRPQNIFCSNKAEILNALVKDVGENNCSVYSLKSLADHDDVHLLQPKDIIYYYDDGILYDKNHVKVMDYDLNVKHEENRRRFGNINAVSDETFNAEYEDRLTETLDDFYIDFEDINAYGIKLKEGKETEYNCCICGEYFGGFGHDPAPYRTYGKCCDACNRKFVIPTRLSALIAED